MSDWLNHVRTVMVNLKGRWTVQPQGESALITSNAGKIRARPMGNKTRVEWHIDPTLYRHAFPATPVPIAEPTETFGAMRNTSVGRDPVKAAADLVTFGLIAAAERAMAYETDVLQYLRDRHSITVATANKIAKLGNGRVYEDFAKQPGTATVELSLAGYNNTARVYGNDVIMDRMILPSHVAEQMLSVAIQMTS